MSIIYDWLKREERENEKLRGELNKAYKKIKEMKEGKRNDMLDGIKYDLTRTFYSFQDFLYDIFYNINDIRSQLSENVKNIITEMQKNKKLPLYEGEVGYLDDCKDLSECYIALSHHWSRLYDWDDNPFPISSNAIEKVFALIPYSKKDMKTKLPIRVMENIFEFVDFYFEKFDRPFEGEYKYTRFKEDRKITMIAALGCMYGLHISPRGTIDIEYPKDFVTRLSAEELANNFENNLKNFKNRFEKGEDNYDEIDKEVYLERPHFKLVDRGPFALSPDTPDEQRFYRSFDLPDYFIHDYYGEVLNKIEQENKKKQKFCAKNDKRFKDAEYILANRKLREKFLGEEYDDNIEIGVANKNKELLEKLKSKNVEK